MASKDLSLNLLFNNFTLSSPLFPSLDHNLNLPLLGQFHLQRFLLGSFFYMGMSSGCYFLLSFTKRSMTYISEYIRSIFNAKKYLTSAIESSGVQFQMTNRYYAVIYGTGNRAGLVFAKYLASKGFNLILIDRSQQPLSDIEKVLKEEFRANPPQIQCIVLQKFDIESLRNAILPIKDLPVKLFINCKNSKQKNTNENPKAFMSAAEGGQDSESEPSIGEDIISRQEIYFAGRENIEGYACLINVFMSQMIRESQNPAVINVDNEEDQSDHQIKKGQLFYQSSVQFQDRFTTLLSKQVRDLNTINVKVPFKKLKGNSRTSQKLCDQTFAYLGIRSTLYIN